MAFCSGKSKRECVWVMKEAESCILLRSGHCQQLIQAPVISKSKNVFEKPLTVAKRFSVCVCVCVCMKQITS